VPERDAETEVVPEGVEEPEREPATLPVGVTVCGALGEELGEPVSEGEGRRVMELEGVVVGVREPLLEALLVMDGVPLGEEAGLAVPDGVCSATEDEALAEAEPDTVAGAEGEVEGEAVCEGEDKLEAEAEAVASMVGVLK
jgi:hypothetical protein